MRCPHCGTDNPEGARFCIRCASPFERGCPSCGTKNQQRAKFCAQCATYLGDTSSPLSISTLSVPPRNRVEEFSVVPAEGKSDNLLDGERKTVTALFADIKGSMDLME